MHLAGEWSICAVCSLWSCCLCKLLRCRPKTSGISLRGKVSIDCLMLANPSKAQCLASLEKGVREEHHEACLHHVCRDTNQSHLRARRQQPLHSHPTPPLSGYTAVFLVAGGIIPGLRRACMVGENHTVLTRTLFASRKCKVAMQRVRSFEHESVGHAQHSHKLLLKTYLRTWTAPLWQSSGITVAKFLGTAWEVLENT